LPEAEKDEENSKTEVGLNVSCPNCPILKLDIITKSNCMLFRSVTKIRASEIFKVSREKRYIV
jgi:hypothetical protein